MESYRGLNLFEYLKEYHLREFDPLKVVQAHDLVYQSKTIGISVYRSKK